MHVRITVSSFAMLAAMGAVMQAPGQQRSGRSRHEPAVCAAQADGPTTYERLAAARRAHVHVIHVGGDKTGPSFPDIASLIRATGCYRLCRLPTVINPVIHA